MLPCRYPNHAYRTACKMCGGSKDNAKWVLPHDPTATLCACGVQILPHYKGTCRKCSAPIVRSGEGTQTPFPRNPKALPLPVRGVDLKGGSPEAIMLWTEAVLNPAGPPEFSGNWPEAPAIQFQVAYCPTGKAFRLPYVTSETVAGAWQVDHGTLCGKFLGHRRRDWGGHPAPPLFYLWRDGYHTYSPLGIALIPVWEEMPIRYSGLLESGDTIGGLWDPIPRNELPEGTFAKEPMPPYVPRWPEDIALKSHGRLPRSQEEKPARKDENQGGWPSDPRPRGELGQLPYGPREGPPPSYDVVAGMAWKRPDPASTQGGPLWSAAPGIPGTAWGPLDPRERGDSNFVQRLQEYGGLEVQRFLDLNWAKLVHSVTKHIFSGPDHQGALLTRRRPVPPIGYGEARDYLIPPVRSSARGPRAGRIRLVPGGLHQHRDLGQG